MERDGDVYVGYSVLRPRIRHVSPVQGDRQTEIANLAVPRSVGG